MNLEECLYASNPAALLRSSSNFEVYLTLRQTNIFKPLSMSRTSFYRTPRISKNIISISFRRDHGSEGAFEPWKHRFYEVDPEKGECLRICRFEFCAE